MFKPAIIFIALIAILVLAYNFVESMKEQADTTYSQSAGAYDLGGGRTVEDTLNNSKSFNY